MGELFDRRLPPQDLEWTGERLVASVRGQVETEHLHRYFLARRLCRGLDVLDVASGEGYGSALIAQTARSVIGVELDAAAVSHARSSYAGERLEYRQGDARSLPLDDSSVDCVVSFETIEHFYDHTAFMAEIVRVLRPGGFLLISSPDRDIYSPSGGHVNLHHLHELTREEFERILNSHFDNVSLLGQRPIIGSVLVGTGASTSGPVTFERREGQRFEASDGLARPLYWVALASSAPLSVLPDSFFFEGVNLDAVAEIPRLRERHAAASREAQEARDAHDRGVAQLALERGELGRVRRECDVLRETELRTSIAHAGELGAMRDRLAAAQAQAEAVQKKLLSTENARSDAERMIEELQTELAHLTDEAAELRTSARRARSRGASDERAMISEIATLRARLDRHEEEAGPVALAELRRKQTALLCSLHRPAPVDTLPDGMSAWEAQDFLALSQSLLFDRDFYIARNVDVATGGHDPVLHYLRHGWQDGRAPGPAFDGNAYLDANPDVARAGSNPLVHYLRHGAAEGRPLEASAADVGAARANADHRDRRFWFFAGDTIDWIAGHDHLTGVGHVTSELMFAAFERSGPEPFIVCVRAQSISGLARLEDADPVIRLAELSDRSPDLLLLAQAGRPRRHHPAPGDHVFFTGVVWNASYAALFRHLGNCGISFSVLVHDVIPITEPHLVTEAYTRGFTDWLTVTLETATTVHVSNEIVKEHIRRWAVAAQIVLRARIGAVRFGMRRLPRAAIASPALMARVASAFVLCVGTIDFRKNQRMLAQTWIALRTELGAEAVPQLVFAGRDDLSLTRDPALAGLFDDGGAVLLESLDDGEIAALYRACLFTVFPSLSEGYGMPVAESLAYGKLCICAALAEVRAHADDLAWYFETDSSGSLRALLKQAIAAPDTVAAANERIRRDYHPPAWADTMDAMRNAAREGLDQPLTPLPSRAGQYDGTVAIGAGDILRRAATWCTRDRPEVSILIVNWNAAGLTLDCIRQVWAKTEGVRYEIIIADNGSAEHDLERLRSLGSGVRLIEIGCNRYFGEANNIAAEHAGGAYLCLLNNDAFVEEGWLHVLLEPLRSQPEVGATGPMFLFPDGRVQEAGAVVDEGGYPVRFGRDVATLTPELLKPKVVDYISAAALVIERDLFVAIGGFDLRYEPSYYEDTDLCFKMRAFGRTVLLCPDARVVHIEGASANGNVAAEAGRKHLGDLNREKFVARWDSYLRGRDGRSLHLIRKALPIPAPPTAVLAPGAPTAIVYTPYALTPGGGERYLLSLVALLARTHHVTLATPHLYSMLRLGSLGAELRLDLTRVTMVTVADPNALEASDIQVVMCNYVSPPLPARGRVNIFHCQFPFPLDEADLVEVRGRLAGYDEIVVNSHYTALHVRAVMDGLQLPDVATTVISPPVPQLAMREKARNRIISVGRIFRGGHSKRHDLLIEAFRQLAARTDEPVELHIAGSSTPDVAGMTYLSELKAAAEGLRVRFHVNVAAPDLEELYAGASIYWHGTGLGSDLSRQPWAAEHFGITVVEAMSAGVVPFALASGGPREIIHHGSDGYLYEDVESLIGQTISFLNQDPGPQAAVRAAAQKTASAFSPECFDQRFSALLGERHGAAMLREPQYDDPSCR